MAFTSKDVMDLRARTGVGMMDCKKALTATDGDMDKAIEYLREKGIATAAKKQSRIASEGIVDSYIHLGGKVGVLVEVNCETDFVARGEQFKNFVHDVALQIAAAKPSYVNKEEVPAAEVEHEKEILKAQALNEDKPKPLAIIEKMVEGRVNKYYKEVCLMEQDFVKDPSKTITQLLNETISSIGEKITVRRFVRYEMGEGLEKKVDNFAEEINAQVAAMKANNNN
ncbi:MAG: translation elongation factor Ts [Eubacteriales bacterium]|nr:translation elongation factor Ts [Eubacteriales bacterium]